MPTRCPACGSKTYVAMQGCANCDKDVNEWEDYHRKRPHRFTASSSGSDTCVLCMLSQDHAIHSPEKKK